MTETNGIPIERCPNCGGIGAYVSVVDGVAKTIACECGYRAPGMAVAGTQAPPEKTRELQQYAEKANAEIQAVLDQTRARLRDAEEVIRKVNNWALAYPLDVFPEPDVSRCARLLKEGGESIDNLAAYARRGAIEWIKQDTGAYFAKWRGNIPPRLEI